MRCLLCLFAIFFVLPHLSAQERRPNIVFIVADDLGFGDLGCYGQDKIRTPAIDRLATEGMRFKQFYSGSPVCAPSRCVLMTGKHSGHAYIRSNSEVQPEGQRPIPADTVTIASILKRLGYRTGAIGKWGLGPFGSSGDPLKHGFDFFFGYNCQRHAHNFYPTFIYRNDQRVPLEGNTGGATGKQYTHDLMEVEALEFIRKHQKDPFFLYLPFTIPHLALQVPEDSLNEYKGKFEETPYKGKAYQHHDTPRAAYAAMITRLDRTVGRIMDLLKSLSLDENTIVFFTSDNGAGASGTAGLDTLFFGSKGKLRAFKGSVHEGGLRVPMIVRWPGKIPAGKTTDHLGAFQDVLPTLCEAAGAVMPADTDGISFLPVCQGKAQKAHPYLYFEYFGGGGQQAVRMGEWKAVRTDLLKKGVTKLQLFNLAKDEGETTDVAAQHPDIVARIERIMQEAHAPSELFPIPALDKK
jgi:arylsulfatase